MADPETPKYLRRRCVVCGVAVLPLPSPTKAWIGGDDDPLEAVSARGGLAHKACARAQAAGEPVPWARLALAAEMWLTVAIGHVKPLRRYADTLHPDVVRFANYVWMELIDKTPGGYASVQREYAVLVTNVVAEQIAAEMRQRQATQG